MSAKTAAVAFAAAAVAVVPGRATADPLIDLSVVRSIEQTAQGTRISFDVDRPAIEDYVRTAAMSNLQKYPGVKIDNITLGGAPGTSVLGVTADVTVVHSLGIGMLRASGTIVAHVALSTGGGNLVEGQLFLDSISLGGEPLPLNGVTVGAGRKQVDLSGVDGAIQRITIESIDASWIAVSIDVH